MRRVLAVLAGLYLLFGGGVARGAEEAPPPSRAAERTADSTFAAVEAARLRATAQPLPESEVFVQSGHSARIARLAWSPDERFIATASDDNTMKLWDVAAGRLVYTYTGHGSVVNAVAFTPDGTRLVTAAARPDNSLHVIERRSGKLLHRLAGHTSGVQDFAFLPGGRLLSVADDGGQAILWDLATATLLRRFSFAELGNLRSVAVLPDGERAVLGSYSGHLALVSLAEGRVLRRYPKQERDIAQIAIHPDGRSFYTAVGGLIGQNGGEGALIRWSLDSDAMLQRHAGPGATATLWTLALSPDGGTVAAGAGNSVMGAFGDHAAEDAVWLWRTNGGALLAKWSFGKDWSADGITALAFSHDGRRLAYSSSDTHGLAIRGIDADAPARVFEGRQHAWRHLAVDGDGSAWNAVSIADHKLAASRRARGDLKSPAPQGKIEARLDAVHRVMRWDLLSGNRADVVDAHVQRIRLLAPTPAGVLSVSRDDSLGSENGLTVVTANAERTTDRTRFSSQLGWDMLAEDAVAISRSGRKLALAHRSSSPGMGSVEFFVSLYAREGTTWRLVKTLPVAQPVTALAFGADEDRLLAGVCEGRGSIDRTGCDDDKGVRLHCADLARGEWVAASPQTTRKISQITVSPGGRFALSTGAHAIGWQTADCTAMQDLWAGDGRFTTAGAWSSDGKRIAVASAGRRIHLWDADTLRIERVLEGFDGRVVGLNFTPDGKTLLALGDNGAMRLWDAESGKLRATMVEFEDGEWMTITPEGYFMGSPDADRKLSVRHGDRVYGMDQFHDVFYRPDIVRRKLAGENIDDLIRVTLDEALRRPPPRVTVSAQPGADGRVRLRLDASDEGGGIGALRVYHNGKLIAADAVQAVTARRKPPAPVRQNAAAVRQLLVSGARRAPAPLPLRDRLRDVEVLLAPGENRVWVTGFNADGTLGARPVTLELPRQPEALARVFVLALGVDRYRKAKDIPTLRYAAKDAKAFSSEMRSRLAKAFPGQAVDLRVLTDAAATLPAVERELDRLRREMRPGDVFVWFIASHGMLDDDSGYNVVLHDADLDRPGRGMLPASQLVEWLKRLPALDQLVVIDTCHAGGLDGTVRGLYDARFAVLARSMGLHVLASASATEEAIDGYKGSGLFTHAMLQAMDDPASDDNRDRRLSATELGRYARDLTQRIARRMRFSQTPLSFHFGRDLVIATFP
jgi:WD40 repeat protein